MRVSGMATLLGLWVLDLGIPFGGSELGSAAFPLLFVSPPFHSLFPTLSDVLAGFGNFG